MSKLDLKDHKIMHELDLNCRRSNSQIAKKVGLSRDSVNYRINKLLEKGHINYFMTIINTMKLGFMWYRTFFKFEGLSPEKEKEIFSWLQKKVSWITKVEGRWDVNTGIFCKTVYEFRDFMDEFLKLFGNYIEEYRVATVTRMWHYHRDYFLGDKQKNPTCAVMGFSPDEKYVFETIDKIDYSILQVILKDARLNIVEIAKKTNTTEMIVKYRLKKLQEKKIILGFRPFFNLHKLNYLYFKLHISLRKQNNKEKIINYLHQHPNTVHTTETVGGHDIETEFQVKTNDELYSHIRKIRELFSDMIKEYEFLQYTREEKFTYLPEIEFT